MVSFQKMLVEYYDLMHKRAVYMTVLQFLRRYCSSDIGKAQETIRVEDQISTVVPEAVVSAVLRDLESVVMTLDLELKTFGEPAISQKQKQSLPRQKAVKKK